MTTIELKFTDDTTSVWLGNAASSTDGYIREYQPTTPSANAASHVESARVTFTGSVALAEAAIAKINQLATQARLYNSLRIGGMAYVQITVGSDVYRSRLIDIRFEPDDTSYKYELAAGTRTGTLIWERVPYKEGSLTQIPLTNTNGNASTDGLTVYSYNDASTDGTAYVKNNYATCGTITGDLPAPLKLELTAGASTTDALDDMIIAVNRNSAPASLVYTFEGESGTGSSDLTSSTDTTQAACSAGKYMALVSSPNAAWIGQIYWALDSAALANHAGNWFKPVVHWYTTPGATIMLKLKLETAAGVVMSESAPVTVEETSTEVATLFPPMQIPPYVLPTTYADMRLQLYLYRSTTDATTLALDFVYLVCMDSLRIYTAQVTPVAGQVFVDDGVEGFMYGTVSSENAMTHTAVGAPLVVEPGKTNRIMYHSLTGTRSEFITMKAWYRPRWRG